MNCPRTGNSKFQTWRNVIGQIALIFQQINYKTRIKGKPVDSERLKRHTEFLKMSETELQRLGRDTM